MSEREPSYKKLQRKHKILESKHKRTEEKNEALKSLVEQTNTINIQQNQQIEQLMKRIEELQRNHDEKKDAKPSINNQPSQPKTEEKSESKMDDENVKKAQNFVKDVGGLFSKWSGNNYASNHRALKAFERKYQIVIPAQVIDSLLTGKLMEFTENLKRKIGDILKIKDLEEIKLVELVGKMDYYRLFEDHGPKNQCDAPCHGKCKKATCTIAVGREIGNLRKERNLRSHPTKDNIKKCCDPDSLYETVKIINNGWSKIEELEKKNQRVVAYSDTYTV